MKSLDLARYVLSSFNSLFYIFLYFQSLCVLPNNETRIVKEVDESGKEYVADELPPREFSITEKLPPLKPAVLRKTIRVRALWEKLRLISTFRILKRTISFLTVALPKAMFYGERTLKMCIQKISTKLIPKLFDDT